MAAATPAPVDPAPAKPAPTDAPAPAGSTRTSHPKLTVPQILAFVAFAIFAVLAIVAKPESTARVSTGELKQVGTFTMFFIGAMLPSDALIRYGRNLLFQTVEDPDKSAQDAPATTLAQLLAFGTFVVIVAAAILGHVGDDEFRQVIDVGRVLVVALLPSDAGIRFGRALYYRAQPASPTALQLKHV